MMKIVNNIDESILNDYYDMVIGGFVSCGFSERWVTKELLKKFEKKRCRISRRIEGRKDYWTVDGRIIFSVEYNAQVSHNDVTVNFKEREGEDAG